MIKAIVFDYGGVVGKETGDHIFKAVSRVYKIKPNRIKKEFCKFISSLQTGRIKERVFWEKLAKNLGIVDNVNGLKEIWLSEHQKHSELDGKVLSAVRNLKNCYKVCLLANTIPFYKKDSVEKKLKQVFPVIIYSYKIGLRKPDKRIYKYTLRRLKVKPEECIIIDDNKKNLICPKQMGMRVVVFKKKSKKKELFEHRQIKLGTVPNFSLREKGRPRKGKR